MPVTETQLVALLYLALSGTYLVVYCIGIFLPQQSLVYC